MILCGNANTAERKTRTEQTNANAAEDPLMLTTMHCEVKNGKEMLLLSYPNSDDAVRCVNCEVELKKYWVNENGRQNLL